MSNIKLQILEDTFKNKFDIEKFKKFTREFFNEPDMIKKGRRIGIWREYDNHINSYYTIATYEDSQGNKVLVMAVELKKDVSVDRARSMQRNFVSKVLDENNLDAAIVAFYTTNEPSWRLSFVRLDYSFTDKGITLDLTPARRYSYLVGENEPNNTARIQLLPIFEDDKYNPTLDEIENAFSVEKVTKDFFEQYKKKYLDLKEHLENNEEFIDETTKLGFEVEKFSEQFAKKLMGQLAFLYFLQKKGWLGVKIVPKIISKQELFTLYNSVDDTKKKILNKIYLKNKGDKYILNIDLISSKDFTEHEAGLLSDIFVNNEKYNEPWGSGYKQFIRDVLWKHCERHKNNFFNDYLEPFFYNALNTKRKNHYFKEFNCKIPFLNGGLFEPLEGYHWKDIDFEIPNELFSNKKDGDKEADGILDIFDRFNFTINEDEPLEKEVAIDPEMLGKIFENLLEVKDRKSKGAFYTPREIVHYMCQESLISYLVNEVGVPYDDMKKFILYGELIKDQDNKRDVKDTEDFKENKAIPQLIYDNIRKIDNALKSVRIADPAVGSGAFPLGMLNEIIKARNNITEYIIRENKEGAFDKRYEEEFIRKWRSPYKMKWETIKNCIFAVDIEPSAVDITKLRLWLSVVIEQEIDDENPEPHPLPNLDMNIHVGDSLIDEYEGIKLFDESILLKSKSRVEENSSEYMGDKSMQIGLFVDPTKELLERMFGLQDRYFDEENEERKRQFKADIDKARDELIRHKLYVDGNGKALEKYEESLKNRTKPYFIWELEFAKVFKEKGGFDIVIGNPPYVGESGNKELFRTIANTRFGEKYYRGKMDFWYFFTSKGIELLKNKGLLLYIAPNNWMTTFGGKNMRQHIISDTTIIKFISFGDNKIFENANQQTMIFILEKDNRENEYKLECSILDKEVENLTDFIRFKTIGHHYNSYIDRLDYINGEPISFLDYFVGKTINKIKTCGNMILQENEVFQGIVVPQENLNKKNLKILGNGHKLNEGIFVLDENEYNALGELNEDEKNLIKPFYTTNEINRYYRDEKNNYYIIYTNKEVNRKIKKYPSIKKHLDKYKDIITSDNKPYGLHRSRRQKIFIGGKIVSLRKCIEPSFSYLTFDSYVSQTFNIIKTDRISLKYLTGILNSNVIKFWLRYKGKMQGSNYQIDKGPLLNIPIIKVDKGNEQNIIDLVDKRINNKNIDEIEVIEKEVNTLVYKFYNLTEREIRIIENHI